MFACNARQLDFGNVSLRLWHASQRPSWAFDRWYRSLPEALDLNRFLLGFQILPHFVALGSSHQFIWSMNWCPTSPAFLQLAQFTSQTFREVKPKRRSTKGGKQRNKSHQQPTKDEGRDARHSFSRWDMKKQSQNQKNFEELVWNHPCWVKRYHNYQPIKALQPLTGCTSQVRPMVLWPTDWSLSNYSLFINSFTSSFWPDIASIPGAWRISSFWTQIFTASRGGQIFGISTFSRNLPSWRASSSNVPKKKMQSKS